jgi:Phage tail lysozyme
MAIKGASVAYVVIGGLLVFSGIKGSSISNTAKSVLTGNLNVTDTEGLSASPDVGSAGSLSTASSGSDSANLLTIARYLVSNGYSNAAAAGIVGCVEGESTGNPEAIGAGSYGIIQEQGSQYANLVTGNPTTDLDNQLQALIQYNNAQGQGLLNMLNQISDPVAAADFYSENFERPKYKDSDVSASVAQQIYAQLTGGK